MQLRHRNLLGYGDQLLVTWRLGPARRFLALETQHRHFLGTPLAVRSALYDERNRPWLYAQGKPGARLPIRVRGFSLSAGVETWDGGLISALVRLEQGSSTAIRDLGLSEETWEDRGVGLAYVLDTRDDAFLPSTGSVRVLRLWQGGNLPGASLRYRRAEGEMRRFFALGKWTLAPGLRFGLTGRHVPRALWFRLGGPDAFQGRDREELWTRNFATVGMSFRYDFNTILRFSLAASFNWHGDRAVELLGREPEPGVALGVKLVTPAGPAELDFGYGEGGRNAIYLSVGYPF